MWHVTIVWNDAELGEGFGDSLEYAEREAAESVPSIYAAVRSEWQFECSEVQS